MTNAMLRTAAALAATLPFFTTLPAMAANNSQVILPPGSSHNWVQQQPTSALGTDEAQVLPDGLAYIGAGGALGGGLTLGYARGMGNGGELGVGLGALISTGAAAAAGGFKGDLFGSWKQQLSRGENMAVSVRGALGLMGLGGATSVALFAGLPLTFDAGAGHLTAEPRITLPNISAGTGGGLAELGLGYIAPLAPRWSLLADVAPGFTFGNNAFQLPIAVGARFSPTATSHVDFTVGNIQPTPAFSAQLGLVGVQGYIGF